VSNAEEEEEEVVVVVVNMDGESALKVDWHRV